MITLVKFVLKLSFKFVSKGGFTLSRLTLAKAPSMYKLLYLYRKQKLP